MIPLLWVQLFVNCDLKETSCFLWFHKHIYSWYGNYLFMMSASWWSLTNHYRAMRYSKWKSNNDIPRCLQSPVRYNVYFTIKFNTRAKQWSVLCVVRNVEFFILIFKKLKTTQNLLNSTHYEVSYGTCFSYSHFLSRVHAREKLFSFAIGTIERARAGPAIRGNELFRHSFVIWCFREHNRGPRRVISIELTFGTNWIFIFASLEIKFLGWKLFLVSGAGQMWKPCRKPNLVVIRQGL